MHVRIICDKNIAVIKSSHLDVFYDCVKKINLVVSNKSSNGEVSNHFLRIFNTD